MLTIYGVSIILCFISISISISITLTYMLIFFSICIVALYLVEMVKSLVLKPVFHFNPEYLRINEIRYDMSIQRGKRV